MEWSLTKAKLDEQLKQSKSAIEEEVGRNVMLTKLDDLINWGSTLR